MSEGNNEFKLCPFTNGLLQDIEDTMEKVAQTHAAMVTIHQDTKHLAGIAESLSFMKTGLMDTVLGKQIVPLDVHKEILEGQRSTYVSIIRALCWAFGVITVFLTGIKYFLPTG